MKIKKMVCSPGLTGFFFDDQLAIKRGAVADGAHYIGKPLTPGFTSVRQPGESVAVMLQLEDNQIAWADCCAVNIPARRRDPCFWPLIIYLSFMSMLLRTTRAEKLLLSVKWWKNWTRSG